MPPPGMLVQRPPQHASPVAQVSPSTRHAPSSWQTIRPLSSGVAQTRPQQSSGFMHSSPAGRQSGVAMQMPRAQIPLQQSCPVAQTPPLGAQRPPPQRPPTQPSAQQALAPAHAWPSDAQPAGFTQTSAPVPVGSGAQTNESQSAPIVHAAPSGRRAASAQLPATHDPEQQSPPAAHPPPFATQWTLGSGLGMVSSTSRRQPVASAASATQTATVRFKAGRRRPV